MKNKKKHVESADQGTNSEHTPGKDPKVKNVEDQHFFKRWKDSPSNNMGNDIAGDVKVANSKGQLEGGKDKRWHMEEEE